MPDDAAAITCVFACQQPLYCQLDSAELLVAPHHLDQFPFVIGAKQREGAHDVQQVTRIQHARYQALLVVGTASTMIQVVQGAGKWV